MSTISDPPRNVEEPSSRRMWPLPDIWLSAVAVLAIGAVSFGLVFRLELIRAVQVWNKSTAYNHCFLILPISLYLIWERRHALLARLPEPVAWPLSIMLPVGLVWLYANQAGIMEGRQLAAITLFQLFMLALLGFKTWRVITFALLYLYFLAPFGAFLTPRMQDFAAEFAVKGVRLLGIPVYSDGLEIDVPGAKFVVAEACAGLRFLIATIALGTLYGYMMYRSWTRRAAFIAVSIVVPIIANGLRVLGIVVLGFILGNAQAAVADHIIYGWVFFSFVSLILILLGLPFREPALAFPVESVGTRKPMAEQAGKMLGVLVLSVAAIALLHSALVLDGPVGRAVGAIAMGLKQALSSQ